MYSTISFYGSCSEFPKFRMNPSNASKFDIWTLANAVSVVVSSNYFWDFSGVRYQSWTSVARTLFPDVNRHNKSTDT